MENIGLGGKNLAQECREFWQKKRPQEPSIISCGLLSAIHAFKEGKLSTKEQDGLIRQVLCNNGKIKGIWSSTLHWIEKESPYRYRNPDGMERNLRQLKACLGHIIWKKVKECIYDFEPSRLEQTDDENAMLLLSSFINSSIYLSSILQEVGLIQCKALHGDSSSIDIESVPDSREPDAETKVMYNQLKEFIKKGLQKACNQIALDTFIQEVLTDQAPRSSRARQQKKRLWTFLIAFLGRELNECSMDIKKSEMNLLMELVEVLLREEPQIVS